MSTEKIKVDVIYKAVGQISESDVTLADASDAIIVGFQVRPSAAARKLAEQEGVDCLLYTSPSPRDRQKSRMPSSA